MPQTPRETSTLTTLFFPPPQFFISLLIIFILLLAAGIVGAVNENTVRRGGMVEGGESSR